MDTETAFRKWLLLRGRHENTIIGHIKRLRVLIRELSHWNVACVDEFLIHLKESGHKNSTINAYVDTIRLFAQMVDNMELATLGRYQKKQRTLKGTFSPDEVERVIYQEGNATDTLFLELCFYCASRPGEIAHLTKNDVTADLLYFRQTKTGEPRIVPIPPLVKDKLQSHISKCKTDSLFVTRTGVPYSDHSWGHMFEKRLKVAGVARPGLTLYSLRHTAITELLRQRIPAQTIAKLCGTSVNMITEVYAHMVLDDVEDAMRELPLVRDSVTMDRETILKKFKGLAESYNLQFDYKVVADRVHIEVLSRVCKPQKMP